MIFPQEFLDTLPRPNVEDYPLAADPFAPIGMPDAAWHPPNDPFPGMLESPRFNGTSNDTLARYYRRAYDAAISCAQPPIKPLLSAFVFRFVCKSEPISCPSADTDWNIGQVLAELDAQGFRK